MGGRLEEKYGKRVVVIAGASSGLGATYAAYFYNLGYEKIVLIDSDFDKLTALRSKL